MGGPQAAWERWGGGTLLLAYLLPPLVRLPSPFPAFITGAAVGRVRNGCAHSSRHTSLRLLAAPSVRFRPLSLERRLSFHWAPSHFKNVIKLSQVGHIL